MVQHDNVPWRAFLRHPAWSAFASAAGHLLDDPGCVWCLADEGDARAPDEDAAVALPLRGEVAVAPGVRLQWRSTRLPSPAQQAACGGLAALASGWLQAQAAAMGLALQAERLSDASRAGSDWLWETDADGRLTWVSDADPETGRTSRGLEVGVLTRELHAPLEGEWRASWDDYLARRAQRQPLRDVLARRFVDGGSIFVSFSGQPRFDEHGRFLGYRGVARDVTFELAQRDLARRTDLALHEKHALEIANRAKDEFLSRMSHEMRTPLNAVIGFSQLLELGGRLAAGDAEQVRQILVAGRHLLALVDDVLDLQRSQAGTAPPALQATALAEVVHDTITALQPHADAAGVRLVDEVAAHWQAWADGQRLRRALFNLVGNSIRYHRRGGVVRIGAEAAGDALRLLIDDDGPGLTEAQIARLFEPFERLGPQTAAMEGTGLGLLIARRLLQQMQGDVGLQPRDGGGLRATVSLQRLASASDAAAPAAGEAAAPLRVLCVEDDRINLMLFEQAMTLHGGIDLRCAESGDEVDDQLDGWTPQLMVIDAHLPGIDGHALLQRLRLRPGLAAVPAVMCSADAMPEDLERARQTGFVDYWTKPIDMAQVFAALDGFARAAAG